MTRVLPTLLPLLLLGAAASGGGDPRDLHSAVRIGEWSYCDQSYCVALRHGAQPLWLCTITVSSTGLEGQAGMHVVSVRSTDLGSTWSAPVALERSNISNVYSTVVGPTAFGRVYAVYNANVGGLRPSLVGGRVDTMGDFYMRWSDDGGVSWSAERLLVPYRTTAVDRGNCFPGHPEVNGSVKMMWTVDQAKIREGTAYFAFTKIGTYPQGPPEEGFVLASSNILTERDANAVRWSLLPDGDHGLAPVTLGGGPSCAFPARDKACVAEEFHIVPLFETAGHFAVFRTTQGYLGATHTRDATARRGWVTAHYAQ